MGGCKEKMIPIGTERFRGMLLLMKSKNFCMGRHAPGEIIKPGHLKIMVGL